MLGLLRYTIFWSFDVSWKQFSTLTHLNLGDIWTYVTELSSWALLVKLLSAELHRIPLMMSQHWFQVMATSHYLSQYWPRSMPAYRWLCARKTNAMELRLSCTKPWISWCVTRMYSWSCDSNTHNEELAHRWFSKWPVTDFGAKAAKPL